MIDYTLPTEIIGHAVTFPRERLGELRPIKPEAFDRWLDQTLRDAKAEAWEEGHEAAAMRVPEGVWHDTASPRTPNPYRKEQNK